MKRRIMNEMKNSYTLVFAKNTKLLVSSSNIPPSSQHQEYITELGMLLPGAHFIFNSHSI